MTVPIGGSTPGRRWTKTTVMAGLEQLLACSAATLAGGGGRLLCLGGEPIATLSDPESIGAVTARVGGTTDLPTVLGMLLSMRPSGVLLLSSACGSHALAVELAEGRAVGAVGPRRLQSMGAWVVELHRRYEEACRGSSTADDSAIVRSLRPGRAFLRESVLKALADCGDVGAVMVLLEGDLHWLHERLEPEDTADFGFLLMELARRTDEGPALERGLESSSKVVMPITRPGEHRTEAGRRHLNCVREPDPASLAEWLDARYVFPFCDGVLDIDGVVEQTLLGRFRTLAAVSALREHGYVRLVDECDESDPSAPTDELADLIAALV